LNVGGGESDISPVIYPQIMESAPYMLELMNIPFSFEKVDHPVSVYDYYMRIKKPGLYDVFYEYTMGLPGLLKRSLKGKEVTAKKVDNNTGPQVLTKEQDIIMNLLKNSLSLDINKKEGYLTLTCSMEEPLLTAQVAEKAQLLLQKYITAFKTNKAKDQLAFIEQRYRDKKADYISAQNRLAAYKDKNLYVSSATASIELDRLQNENDLAYTVYSELAKSLEQSQIQVKRQTPVFAIIKPVLVPLEKFKPQRTKIVLIMSFLGLLIGVGFIGGIELLKYVKQKHLFMN
jgi:uncharacterized protein involved in exopolysaccharide biosynthesis